MAYDKQINDFIANNKNILTPKEIVACSELDYYLFQNSRKVKTIIPKIEYLKIGGVPQPITVLDNNVAYLVKSVIYPEVSYSNVLPPAGNRISFLRYAPRDLISFSRYPQYNFCLGGSSGGDYEVTLRNTSDKITITDEGFFDGVDTFASVIADLVSVGGGGGLSSIAFTNKIDINDVIINFDNVLGSIFDNSLAFCYNFLIQ